jgi:hypothetical protein
MGCLGTHRSGKSTYAETIYPEDGELRIFEQVDLMTFSKSFNAILPRICLEKDVITQEELDNFILKDFNVALKKAINVSFFHKEDGGKVYYDAKKVKLLLFLLTTESEVHLRKKYYDKVI